MRRIALVTLAVLTLVVAAFACSSHHPHHGVSPGPVLLVGNGSDGDLQVGTVQAVNLCHRVLSADGIYAKMSVASGLVPGEMVLLIQMQDDAAAQVDGTSGTISPAAAGTWELDYIQAISSNLLMLSSSLAASYDSNGTRRAQLCTVPQYHDVHVLPAGHLHPVHAWDGTSGGIVFLVANGTVLLENSAGSAISAFADGFQGGAPSDLNASATGVTLLTTPSDQGGGRGEGIDARGFGDHGRGAFGSGGGGGDAQSGGGGGGGGAGVGGAGGWEFSAAGTNGTLFTGGVGGDAVDAPLPDRLLMGGGGGGGQNAHGVASAGARGGGIVVVSVATLTGNGRILAGGNAAVTSTGAGFADGAGGGGGGGTIVVAAGTSTYTGSVSASGGHGGDVNAGDTAHRGPGGGGGGGRVYLRGVALVGTALDITQGNPGRNLGATSFSRWGATTGGIGVQLQE